jgi:hypothetical protein
MGEPLLCPEAQTNAYGVHEYFTRLTFGSSTVSSYFGGCGLVVARNSAGNFTLTLPKAYRTLLGFSWAFQDASGAILFAVITSETLDTDGKIIVETRTEAGTATDPTSGDKLFLSLKVSSDYLNDKFVV